MKINETRMMVLGVRLVAILIVACAVPAMSAESKPGNGAMPWDSAALVKMPPIHATTERPAKGLRSLFHEGADYKGKPTWVFAYYAAPQGTPPAGGWPAVVCAHGGGGTAYPGWVRNWNSHGYAAIAMDLEGHLPGGKDHGMEGNLPLGASHENAEPARVDWFGDRALPDNEQWFYHAVADVIRANSLLCSFPEINPKKIGLTGISWGGDNSECTARPRLPIAIAASRTPARPWKNTTSDGVCGTTLAILA